MKSIFVVHSNITYLISLGIIQKENMSLNDVMIISDGYNCKGPIPINTVKVEANRSILRHSIARYLRLYFDPRCELYRLIDDFLDGDSFIAYVPVLHLIKKLVILHPNCIQFHFIEEGAASYFKTMTLPEYAFVYGNNNWFYPKGWRGFKQRLHCAYKEFGFKARVIETIPIAYMNHDNETRKFYCLSEEAYPALKWGEKIIVDLSSLVELFSDDYHIEKYSKINIWIGDPDVEQWYGTEPFTNCILNKLLPAIKGQPLYVRFHYRESMRQRANFIALLEQNKIEYIIIDDYQIMELVFINSNKCKCFSFQSSLLIYAKILGQETYSIAEGIPKLRTNIDEVMPCYSSFVKYI